MLVFMVMVSMSARAQSGWRQDRAHVRHTSDGGATWQLLPTGQETFFASVAFRDSLTGLVVSQSTASHTDWSISRTTNGGRDWTQIATPGIGRK